MFDSVLNTYLDILSYKKALRNAGNMFKASNNTADS